MILRCKQTLACLALATTILAARTSTFGQQRLYVNVQASPGGTGLDWQHAYKDLQDALDYAYNMGGGFEIWVAMGQYTPDRGSGLPGLRFEITGAFGLYGGFSGTETQREERNWEDNVTTLSGDLGNGAFSGIVSVLTGGGVLDGFTVTSGRGSAISISKNDFSIVNCIMSGNSGRLGGAITTGPMVQLEIRDCVFRSNSASSQGGAIWCSYDSVVLISDCYFWENSADFGGAIYSHGCTPITIQNCVFAANHAGSGGAVAWDESVARFHNSSFSANSGGALFGGSGGYSDLCEVRNCILWGDSSGTGHEIILETWWGGQDTLTIEYSDIENGLSGVSVSAAGWLLNWGQGNIDSDPLYFGLPSLLELEVGPGSPVIDAGSNLLVPAGLLYDIKGNERFLDDPTTVDTGVAGNGHAEVVDMGAHEYEDAPCFADCDKSTGYRVLDIFDFLCFQNRFVNAEPYACDCDTTTGNGVCDVFDFLCFQNAFVSGCP